MAGDYPKDTEYGGKWLVFVSLKIWMMFGIK
jgi:hypothetical protein